MTHVLPPGFHLCPLGNGKFRLHNARWEMVVSERPGVPWQPRIDAFVKNVRTREKLDAQKAAFAELRRIAERMEWEEGHACPSYAAEILQLLDSL